LLYITLYLFACIQKVFAMRLVIQRVQSASVTVDNQVVSSIGPGLVALVGLHQDDSAQDLDWASRRLLACKLWASPTSGGMWRQSVVQREYDVLLVSQFTLYGKLSRKFQPDYKEAMKAVPAQELYSEFVDKVKGAYASDKVKDGVFGAMMEVALVNDGPVTLVLDSRDEKKQDTTEEETASTD
jgi:D-aminoacyl-tRNA deacylase